MRKLKVEFNAQKALCVYDVFPALKERYELVVSGFAEQLLAGADATKLEKIIITEHFIDDVLSFQREKLNSTGEVTNNEYGRAFGKLLYAPQEEKYYIFLDSEYASFLIDDEILDAMTSKLDDNTKGVIFQQRRCAMNLIAHELEHFKFALTHTSDKSDTSLRGQCKQLLFQLFDEYCASRNATEISGGSVFQYDGDYMLKIEKYIMQQRWSYNTRELSLNEFVGIFHQYTRQALMNIVAHIGAKHGTASTTEVSQNCRCGDTIEELEKMFCAMFASVQDGQSLVIQDELVEWLLGYYAKFEVYISDTNGLYYSIPFDERGMEL